MEIIIDYNNDRLFVNSNGTVAIFKLDKFVRMSTIQSILEEVFNKLAANDLGDAGLGVSLSKYDEDRHIGIGEW